jgi:hypothetical protein
MDETQPKQGRAVTVPSPAPTLATRQQLYINNLSNLRDAGYSTYPTMLYFDAERTLEKLSLRLHRFICDSDSDFLRLAECYSRNVAAHLKRFYTMISEHSRLIYSAIERSLYGEPEDRAIEVEDIHREVSLLMFPIVNSLLGQGTAKLSTRIFALTRKHAYFYHVAPRRTRKAVVEQRIHAVGDLGVETLTEMELADIRASELENDVA